MVMDQGDVEPSVRFDNLFDSYDSPSALAFRRRSQRFIVQQGRNLTLQRLREEKVVERRAFLAAHPKERLFVNAERLKQIIDYKFFKCSPYSSVARGEAIRGSDIDGGVVVTDSPTTIEQQMAFIAELRSQGYSVYHHKEINEAAKDFEQKCIAWEQASGETYNGENSSEMSEEAQEAERKFTDMDMKFIDFFSQDEIRQAISRGILQMPLAMFFAGVSVK